MSRAGRIGRRRGVTLPEIMIAIFIMSMGVMIFATAFPGANQLILRTRHEDTATAACQSQLELYRGVGYASLPAIASGASQASESFAVPSQLTGGAGQVTFTRVDAGFNPTTLASGRVRVEATATWFRSARDRGSVKLTTLIVE
jgi:prepilin-type N-terminal cleavage/methylation domain-containing protein